MKWGKGIPVNGKRPVWLEMPCVSIAYQRDHDEWFGPTPGYPNMWQERDIAEGRGGWASVTAIRLPADHFAYKALDAGFEPWPGGDAAPADWDGGEVLLRCGATWTPGSYKGDAPQNDPVWQRGLHGDPSICADEDIIGYHKRTPAPAIPADTVTIARMTEAEAQSSDLLEAAFERYKIPNASWIAGWMAAHHRHGLIREETLAERFTRETGIAVTPEIEKALSWKK